MPFPELIGLDKFAHGRLIYTDHFGNDDSRNTRIVISAEFGDSGVPLTAIVDTGALWCIIGPEEAEGIEEKYLAPLSDQTLWVRGTRYYGKVYRIPITLRDEQNGTDITVDSTVFIPVLAEDETWLHPNFLGLDGFLHRLRFAVDPAENAFYFGAMED